MSQPKERTVQINGHPCRVWEKGDGRPLGYLAGYGGLPKWTPVLDKLAEQRRVIAPSPPGYPGSQGHEELDNILDWALATQELLETAGLEGGDLVGVSVGAALAAEVAAIWGPAMARKLVLVSPLGIFDEAEPVTDFFAVRPGTIGGLMCADAETFEALTACPPGADETEWRIETVRASTAAARMLWPMCDTGVVKRLPRIRQDTLLLLGEEDRILPRSYARRFTDAISGKTDVRVIPGAGHLADLDQPAAVAEAILKFCG